MKKIRFIIAIMVAKCLSKAFKIYKKDKNFTTFRVAEIALKIYPELLRDLQKPEKIIAITGTNGKTSVTNLIADLLTKNNIEFVSDKRGANLEEGVITALLESTSIFGKMQKKYGVFEIDERVSPLIYRYMVPNYLIITNILRDSIRRNANTDYISYILESAIPKETKIIVNGDDIIASSITTNEKQYFGISKQEGETKETFNITLDIINCPLTDEKLQYDFVRMNHQGRLSNNNKYLRSPELDFTVTNIDYDNNVITVYFKDLDEEHDFNIVQESMFNIYNELAVIAGAYNLGIKVENIKLALKDIKLTNTRYTENKLVDNKLLVKNLSKGQNPGAGSNVFKSVKDSKGKKDVILYIADKHDNRDSSETIMWLYEIDFEFLNDENINKIMIVGPREKDIYARFKMANVSDAKLQIINDNTEILETIKEDYEKIDKIFLLNDMYFEKEANKIKEMIIEEYGN